MQGPQYYVNLENALLLEIKELGFNAVIINAEAVTSYRVYPNSFMGRGFD